MCIFKLNQHTKHPAECNRITARDVIVTFQDNENQKIVKTCTVGGKDVA